MSIYGRCNTMNGNQTRTYPYTQEMCFRPTKQHNNTTCVYWMTQFHAISRGYICVSSISWPNSTNDPVDGFHQLMGLVFLNWVHPKMAISGNFHDEKMWTWCSTPGVLGVLFSDKPIGPIKTRKIERSRQNCHPSSPLISHLKTVYPGNLQGCFFFLFLMGLLRSLNLNLLGNLVFCIFFGFINPTFFHSCFHDLWNF